MSTAMNFGSKSFQPRPPDKGSFPLDHFGECRSFKEKFMKCLRDNKFENALCRKESKAYLECRMERQVPGDMCDFWKLPQLPEHFFPGSSSQQGSLRLGSFTTVELLVPGIEARQIKWSQKLCSSPGYISVSDSVIPDSIPQSIFFTDLGAADLSLRFQYRPS
uniref:Cytochrome c oxidase assembly protein COX19 n=1 Tax=Neovison vison TaxID=452646 RepID=A0A8C7A6Y0_NEOVI